MAQTSRSTISRTTTSRPTTSRPTTSRSTTWVNDILAGLAAASGVGYLATAYTISRWLTRTYPADVDAPVWSDGTACETASCTTSDGIVLDGWIMSPPRPRGTMALFHGMRHNRLQMLSRIEFLTRAGYRCVAFDHRGHGQSGGKRATFGWCEAQDVAAVAAFIAERWPGEPAAALGISMGAAALCFAAATTAPFQAFILESLYHDLGSAFRRRVGNRFPPWFAHYSRGVVWITERRLGVSIDAIAPADHVQELAPRPILLVTGSDDPHAPPEDVERLFERCADPREFHLVHGADHMDVADKGGTHYRDLVLGFLERHVPLAG